MDFVVPVAFVSFFYERRHLSNITRTTILLTFLWRGLLGVFAASLLEPIIIHGRNIGNTFLVGVVEEFAKVPGVLVYGQGPQVLIPQLLIGVVG